MSACDHFIQNAWRPDLCSTCQRAKSEHDDSASGSRSWRRKSEPNPNNAITGVRISALASKFQARDVRSGSIPETESERARTLDRKTTRNKEKKINTSRSTELLVSSSSTSASTSAISSSNQSAQLRLESTQTKTQELRSKTHTSVTATVPHQSCESTTSSLVTQVSVVAAAYTSKSIPSHAITSKPKTTSSVISSGQGKVRTAALPSSGGKESLTTRASSAVKPSSTGAESARKYLTNSSLKSSSTSSSSTLISQPAVTVKNASVLKEKVPRLQQKRRVSIPDLQPEVIGHDGGLGNLFPEEEVAVEDSDDHIYFSLTDEEKQFALLALGNTVWNSDTKNLQVEAEVAKRGCREFEDVSIDQLWSRDRFKSLVNCDPVKKPRHFGTFPKISTSRQPKVSITNVNLIPDGKKVYRGPKENNTTSVRLDDDSFVINRDSLRGNSYVKGQGQSSVEGLRCTSSGSSVVNSDSEGRANYGSSCGSADSGIEIAGSKTSDPKENLPSTSADVTDSLLTSSNHLGFAQVDDRHPQSLIEKNTPDLKVESTNPNQTRSQSVNSEKNHAVVQSAQTGPIHTEMPSSPSMNVDDVQNNMVADRAAQEGFQVVSLLNDVLKVYGDLNESSTDDFSAKAATKEALKGKKSSDFEARMASVAATLDLTKQQQRGKRQAPRPPVSPPPEPNLAEAVSPKKVVNQPDPVFKMVTVGKSIVTLPPQQDVPANNSVPDIISYGLEDFGSFPETSDSLSSRTNGDGKSKKGITSFFRNILRRGKESTESFESANPDVQFNVKPEKKDLTGAVGTIDIPDEDPASSSVDQKGGPKSSSQDKVLIIPPTSPPQKHGGSDGMSPDGAGTNSGDGVLKSQLDTAAASTISTTAAASDSHVKVSPSAQRKTSQGLASPKMMLKRATVKLSPPASHHTTKTQEKEQDTSSSAAKPNPGPKPAVPPSETLPVAPVTDLSLMATVKEMSSITKDKESTSAPNVVHRRPKSPKRTAPPVPPTRSSVNTGGKAGSSESRNVDLAKELEWRLKKTATEQSGSGTLSRSELRESTRRSMPVPPSPPGERKEKSTTTGLGSPPVSPIRESRNSLPSSPSSPTGTSFDFVNTEWSGGSTSTIDDELPKFSEKIELPTVATQSRKGFLGKLGANRKTKAPQPPSVKRTKSITQSSTLPRGDKKNKKINVADISGPVIVTDITNTSVLDNRRNTISLGDEPAFVAMSASCPHPGGTNSTASVDKSGFDEFDIPFISPLGSLENLYEAILPKPVEHLFHYYDPPTSPKVLCPNIPADGYLEPVPPLSSTAAVTANLTPSSSLSLPAAVTTVSNLSPSSSTSSASSATTNVSVVKSPSKSKTTSSRIDRAPNSKDSGSSNSSHSTSTSSSETNSSENSGSSLPDSVQILSRHKSEPVSAKVGHSNISCSSVPPGLGTTFVEPEMTEQRRLLLASQPIYEEIPNGGNEDVDDFEDNNFSAGVECVDNGSSKLRGVYPPPGTSQMSKNQMAHAWLQQSHTVGPPLQAPSSAASLTSTLLPVSSASAPSLGAMPSSPSHALSKQPALSLSSSQIMTSSIMSTSLTSSMLPPPPPPPDHLPAPYPSTSFSASRETISSESDTQSNCSNDAQSNCSTLSRPRPVPRRRPKRPDTGGSDQYVSMNKPNAQVSLSEDKLRDVFTKLTSITFHALQDIYAQCERILSVDRLDIPNSKMMKWTDFDIYGQPLHASGRCVVYNAKMRVNNCPCQMMILHSRPATEMYATSHPSLLRPSAVFADTIPFSFLTPDFIKTSQLLQNSVYDSSQARCFVAVGAFDIVESLDSHLALLRETMAQDLNVYLNVILTAAIQLLSAMSHCLDQGFSVTETDYNDVFLITRSDLRGKVVAFLPRQRSLDVPQGEAMCNFLDRLLADNMPHHDDDSVNDESSDEEGEKEQIISAPRKVVSKLRSMLLPRRVECLGQVRTAVEYLLWGPTKSQLTLSPSEVEPAPADNISGGDGASREQELYVWLEKERVSAVGRLARNVPGLGAGLSLEEFYTLKFLLKSSAGCLAESLRRLSR